jgi:hypothetical protein
MASGHMNRVKRPDTWLHRPMLQNVKKALANPEPSTHDRFCCRSRLKASANNDSLTLTRSAAGTGHDGSVGAGPRTAVLFVLP